MAEIPTANIIALKQKRYSLAWIIPIIAIAISCILYIRWEMNRGPQISITFNDAGGLTIDSPIMFRGAVVGRVESISLNGNHSNVVVKSRLDDSAAGLAVEGSRWWIVGPSFSFQEVSGLDTIVGPRYIQAQIGSGTPSFSFSGSANAIDGSGKSFTLISNSAKDIAIGTQIFYKGIEIGSITNVELAENASTVRLHFNIQSRYAPLVRTNSIFWNVSGISIEAGLTGINLRSGPLVSLIRGGVNMATPNNAGDIAPKNYAFNLLKEHESKWLEWSPEINLTDQATSK